MPNILQSASVFLRPRALNTWMALSFCNKQSWQLESQLLRTFKGSQKDHPVSWRAKRGSWSSGPGGGWGPSRLNLKFWLLSHYNSLELCVSSRNWCWLGLMLIGDSILAAEDANFWDERDAPSDVRCLCVFLCCFHHLKITSQGPPINYKRKDGFIEVHIGQGLCNWLNQFTQLSALPLGTQSSQLRWGGEQGLELESGDGNPGLRNRRCQSILDSAA